MRSVNAYLGISLGKSYYSNRRLAAYCAWSKVNTNSFAFLIGDDIYRFTLQALKGLSPKAATERARRKGDEVERQLGRLLASNQCSAQIIRWKDLETLPRYKCIFDEASRLILSDETFELAVRKQIFENLGSAISTSGFNDQPVRNRKNKEPSPLYLYMLHEISGLSVMSEDMEYPLEIYPGKDLFLMKQIYRGLWPTLRTCLPAKHKRRFKRLELGE